MKTKHAAYSLYRKKNKSGASVWYARYWDADERRYSAVRSTGVVAAGKRGRRAEADEAARFMLDEVRPGTGNSGLLSYVSAYWDAGHEHFQEREKLQGKKVSVLYIRKSREIMRLYVEPYAPFQKMKVSELTGVAIRRWMLYLANKGLSAVRIDGCLQTIRAPVRYGVSCGDIGGNPFQNIKAPAKVKTEKGCLTREEAQRLADVPFEPKKKLAVMLGVLSGMRLGEVRGLHYEDISGGMIHITRNWQNYEDLKAPKSGSARTVPLPSVAGALLDAIPAGSGYIFTGRKKSRPVCVSSVQEWFYSMLGKIGITEKDRKERRITFHSGRHTFVTLGRQAGISAFEIQALAGHKSGAMMEHYSHAKQVIDLNAASVKLEAVIGRSGAKL
ncbi:MAG: site-specific integrase [Spirochaetaceae bacterium]|nr:site-specific integrase [Spirochaetaceae bacterium]